MLKVENIVPNKAGITNFSAKITQNINLMKYFSGRAQSALKILFYIENLQHHMEENTVAIGIQYQSVGDKLDTFIYSQH